VVRLLGVEDFFEGITYCDYAQAEKEGKLLAKPHRDMFLKAMKEAGVSKVEDCYFIGEYCRCLIPHRKDFFGLG
jgi:pyrimidine and pyridine-specific 5'-nucleotidase